MLIKGLPPDALVRLPVDDRGRDRWTVEVELLAQLIEVVSIGTAERAIREPIRIPRPDWMQPGARQASEEEFVVRPAAEDGDANPYRAAIRGLMASTPPRRLQSVPASNEEQSA